MDGLFFLGGVEGQDIARWLCANYPDDIALAVVPSSEDPCHDILKPHAETISFSTQENLFSHIISEKFEFDYGFLLWFGPVLHEPLLSCPKNGFISMHPAYLPFTRGSNFNIWPIVDEVPFGVSLFMVNDIAHGIDTGDIVVRKEIPYSWLDNGQTLREKAKKELGLLFMESYPKIRAGEIVPQPQDLSVGTTHYKRELEQASRIELEKSYRARDLLNWLRARTYPGYPACWFRDGDEKYEVRVSITKVDE